MMTTIELVELANKLSNEDMCDLISIWADRIEVFVGSTDKILLTGGLSHENPACMNGPMIQINIDQVIMDDVNDDSTGLQIKAAKKTKN